MRTVNLNDVDTSLDRTLCSVDKSLLDPLNPFLRQLVRLGEAIRVRNRTGCPHVVRPPVELLGCGSTEGKPGCDSRCLAPGVGKLDADLLVLGVGKGGDVGEVGDVVVGPDTQIFRCDTSFRRHGGGFEEGETWSAKDDTAD